VLTPRQAIMLAAAGNLVGSFFGTRVAETIGSGLVDTNYVSLMTVLAALLAGICWNLLTWWLALPSSSSHALIGGLCGAALASAHGQWSVLHWSTGPIGHVTGLWPKVVVPMFVSPIAGFVIGALFMYLIYAVFRKATPRFVNLVFGKLQLVSAAWMSFSHGTSDAQKTMGIIVLALITGTKSGAFNDLPESLHFLQTTTFQIPPWVIGTCAFTIALGTAGGGWRIIQTMGHKMVKLQPVHGFAAETTAAFILFAASRFGMPLSTTHVISTSIMGVGATKRLSAVKWGIVGRILWAWVLTLPVTGLLGYGLMKTMHAFGGH
jgi:PiT family inorganic phosphate transporter